MSKKDNNDQPKTLSAAKARARRDWARWRAATDPEQRGYAYWYDQADEWELAAEYDAVERDWT